MKNIILFVIFSVFCSCDKTNNANSNFYDSADTEDYFYGYVGFNKSNTLLTINTRFDECGEWGGHFEKITIFNKIDRKIYAKYEESNFDCNNGNQNPEIIKRSEIKITETHKTAIKDYLKKLVEIKSESFVRGNAGNSYSAISQDSTFIINTYNNNENCKNAFKTLKRKLDF